MNMKALARTNTIIRADEWPLRSDLQPLQLVFQTKPCLQTKMSMPEAKSNTRINKPQQRRQEPETLRPKGLFISVIVLLLTSTLCNLHCRLDGVDALEQVANVPCLSAAGQLGLDEGQKKNHEANGQARPVGVGVDANQQPKPCEDDHQDTS